MLLDTNKIKNLFIHEWQSKLVSLLLAITLWFYVTYIKNQVTYSVSLPLRYNNLPSELIIMDARNRSANIRVTVHKNDKEIRDYGKLFTASVDLSAAQVGRHNYLIVLKRHDPKLKIKARLIKDRVSLKIDNKITKTLPIKAKIIGTPRQGYLLDSIQLSRSFITIVGPKTELDDIQQLETGPIDISDASNNISISSPVSLPILAGTKYKKNVKIKLIISERTINNSFGFKIKVTGLQPGLLYSGPKKLTLKLQFPGRYLKNINQVIVPLLDLSHFKRPGHYDVPITIKAPDAISLQKPAPVVSIELKSTSQ